MSFARTTACAAVLGMSVLVGCDSGDATTGAGAGTSAGTSAETSAGASSGAMDSTAGGAGATSATPGVADATTASPSATPVPPVPPVTPDTSTAAPAAASDPAAAAAAAAAATQPDGAAAAATTAQAQTMLDQTITYIKENKMELAEKSLAQLEALKPKLPAAYHSKIDSVRKAFNAAKSGQGLKLDSLLPGSGAK